MSKELSVACCQGFLEVSVETVDVDPEAGVQCLENFWTISLIGNDEIIALYIPFYLTRYAFSKYLVLPQYIDILNLLNTKIPLHTFRPSNCSNVRFQHVKSKSVYFFATNECYICRVG